MTALEEFEQELYKKKQECLIQALFPLLGLDSVQYMIKRIEELDALYPNHEPIFGIGLIQLLKSVWHNNY